MNSMKNCANCMHCNLDLDLDKEEVTRTCSIDGKDVDKDGICVNHKEKVLDYTRNMSIVDNCYEPFSLE